MFFNLGPFVICRVFKIDFILIIAFRTYFDLGLFSKRTIIYILYPLIWYWAFNDVAIICIQLGWLAKRFILSGV